MTVLEKKVLSSDGIHMLAGKVYLPEIAPIGYLQIVHGMCEHIARYDEFARYLADRQENAELCAVEEVDPLWPYLR